MVPLRADVVGRPRHRALPPDPRRRRVDPRRDRSRLRRRRGARRGASRDVDDRPHARRPRRAHDLRSQARRLGLRPRARPHPRCPSARRDAGRQALGRRRHLLRGRSGGRAGRLRAARARARSELDADPPARPPCRGAERARAPRDVTRAVRARDPPSRPDGGARGRGALRQRSEGVVGDAAQAEPDRLRADLRAGARRPCRRGRRARERRALARAGHLPLLGRADRVARRVPRRRLHARPARLAAGRSRRPNRANAREPGLEPSAVLQPAFAARTRRGRPLLATMRTGLSSVTRCARGTKVWTSRSSCGPTPRSPRASTWMQSSTSRAYTRHVDVVFERLRALSREHVHA